MSNQGKNNLTLSDKNAIVRLNEIKNKQPPFIHQAGKI